MAHVLVVPNDKTQHVLILWNAEETGDAFNGHSISDSRLYFEGDDHLIAAMARGMEIERHGEKALSYEDLGTCEPKYKNSTNYLALLETQREQLNKYAAENNQYQIERLDSMLDNLLREKLGCSEFKDVLGEKVDDYLVDLMNNRASLESVIDKVLDKTSVSIESEVDKLLEEKLPEQIQKAVEAEIEEQIGKIKISFNEV